MGHFDDVTATAFKKDACGNAVYFPRGVFGPGYVIDSEETRKRIWNLHKKSMMITTVVIVPLIIIIGLVLMVWFGDTGGYAYGFIFFISIPIFYVWDRNAVKKFTRGLPITTEDLHFIEIPYFKSPFKWDRQRRRLFQEAVLIILISALCGAAIALAFPATPPSIPFILYLNIFLGTFRGGGYGIILALLWFMIFEGGRWWRSRKAISEVKGEGPGLLLFLLVSLLFATFLPILGS